MSLAEYQAQLANEQPDNGGKLFSHVDATANLAGSNKMEILLFSLGTQETFGINVFKVKEVCRAVPITRTPNMPLGVEGLVSLRGRIIPVLALGRVVGMESQAVPARTMMVTEYCRHVLGFLVHEVDRIISVDWDKVRPAEGMLARNQDMITAITELPDGKLVSILDVERVLAQAFGEEVVGHVDRIERGHEMCVFFIDDSTVARKKISEVLDRMGVRHMHATNGLEAWGRLKDLADTAHKMDTRLYQQIQVVLVDAEMPAMDGYVLTRNIKADSRFDNIPVVMHSSLSSEANRDMGKRVGVDHYVAKFNAADLSNTLRPLLQM
jgi:two-component system chemotaxis response regulator CheV